MNRFTQWKARALLATAAVTACAVGATFLPQASATSNRATSATTAVSTVDRAAPGSIHSRIRGRFGIAGTVRGTFEPVRFFVRKGDPYAFGVAHMTLRRANGDLVGSVTKKISIPVRNATNPARAVSARATCDILHLVLGPLNLDVLGLRVHLNRVVLNIVAATGAGRLLGNLLCAVTGLLDGTGLLNALRVANLLNRILNILRVA